MMQKLLIRYLLNAMHCEKNLCENMTKTILAIKDSYGSREDMRKLGIREELWFQPAQNNRETYHIPSAPYILKGEQRSRVMDIIRNLKTPSNYVGAIHKCLEEGKLRYMKSHDYHILMHQVHSVNPEYLMFMHGPCPYFLYLRSPTRRGSLSTLKVPNPNHPQNILSFSSKKAKF
jgi:hypothetical protein